MGAGLRLINVSQESIVDCVVNISRTTTANHRKGVRQNIQVNCTERQTIAKTKIQTAIKLLIILYSQTG